MKIYTKTGDTGTTALIGGSRIKKSDLQLDCYGTVDELMSWIGLIRDQKIASDYFDELTIVQDRLFTLSSFLACDSGVDQSRLPQLLDSDIDFLEKRIDIYTEQLPKLKSFLLPGGHTCISYCHIARTVCRRAERRVSELNETIEILPIVGKYLNRMSDYLFVFSRKLAADNNIDEIAWKPAK